MVKLQAQGLKDKVKIGNFWGTKKSKNSIDALFGHNKIINNNKPVIDFGSTYPLDTDLSTLDSTNC